MIELLAGALVVHGAFLEAKRENRRVGARFPDELCVHGRGTLQSCYHCPREIARKAWADWKR